MTMKKNTLFSLFVIVIIALLFRLWFLDKPEGLWNDEYISWFIASKKNFSDFFYEMFRNCHTPFYYFFLKFWMLLFTDSDISLRISSVVPSLLSVITMFFAGKEFKDKNFGIFISFLTAISSFCIYFAQEVRLYALLILFSSLTVLYFIKCIKVQSALNLIFYFLFNALICVTHTLGIIFSFFNIFAFFIYLYRYNELYRKKFASFVSVIKYILPFLIAIALISPFLFTIAFSNSLSQFWSAFSFSKIFFTFTDYFSPVQTNIINSPDSILTYIYRNNTINYIFIIFAVLPLLIGLYGVINAVRQKNAVLNALLISSGLFFLSLILISLTGRMILITKYSSEIYPVLIIAAAYGFISIKNKKIKTFIILLFTGLNLFYLCFSDDAAPKRTRPEGNLAVVKLLENSRLKNTDYVLLTYYDVDRFKKYLTGSEKYKFYSVSKSNFNIIMFDNDDYFETVKYGKAMYKDYFREYPNKSVIKYSNENFVSKMKKGERIGIIFLNTVSFISNEQMQIIVSDYEKYNKTPFIFLTFSALRNSLLYSFKNDYKIDSITQSGDWILVVYKKTN